MCLPEVKFPAKREFDTMRTSLRGLIVTIVAVVASSFGPSSAQQNSKEFDEQSLISSRPNFGDEDRREDPDFPIFPKLGDIGSDFVVDYYFNYDCLECALASKAIFKMLEEGFAAEFVFHAVSTTAEEYEEGILDSVLYSVEPELFTLFHFSSMAEVSSGNELIVESFIEDLPALTDNYSQIWARLESPDDWSSATDLNNRFVKDHNVGKLPVFVIAGTYKYEGFTDADMLKAKIVQDTTRAMLKLDEGKK